MRALPAFQAFGIGNVPSSCHALGVAECYCHPISTPISKPGD